MLLKTRYIGDAGIRGLLNQYACPYPFHSVRAMMMGEIASPLMASPTAMIESLWEGELPEFETTEEAETFFGGLLGLWNHLARYQDRSRSFNLVASRPPLDRKGLEHYCRMRVEEIVSLLEGFLQGEEDIDLPSELAKRVVALEDTAGMFAVVVQVLADETVTSDGRDLVELREGLGNILEIANRECAGLVWEATDYRKSQLSGTSPPTIIH